MSKASETRPESSREYASFRRSANASRSALAVHASSCGGHLVGQRAAAAEALDAEPVGQRHFLDAIILAVRVLLDLPGVVLRPEEARVLAGPGERPLHQERGQQHPRRQPVGPGPDRLECRGVAGIVVPRGDLVEEGARLGMPGEELVRRVEVVRMPVRERPHDGQPIGARGEPRQVLAERDAGRLRGDRLELAADLGRRVGLQVERVELARPAGQEDQDHRLRPPGRSRLRGRSPREQAVDPQAEEPGEADLEELAAGDARRVPMRRGHEHVLGLEGRAGPIPPDAVVEPRLILSSTSGPGNHRRPDARSSGARIRGPSGPSPRR